MQTAVQASSSWLAWDPGTKTASGQGQRLCASHNSDTESDTDSDTDTDSDSDSGVSETEADDYARVVRVLAEDLADYQPPHKRVRFTIGTGMFPNSESNSCFRSIRVPSTPTSAN